MEDLIKLLIFACLLFWPLAFAAPVEPHESGGSEHVVIIDKSNPTPPRVADVLERLALHEDHADVHHLFNNSAFVGFAASMKAHCLDLLANMTDVRRVEASVNVQHAGFVPPPSPSNPPLDRRQTSSSAYTTRPDAPWGLQRISTTANVHGNAKAMDYTYAYPSSASSSALGQGADIYILDTGLYTSHNIFSNRAEMLWSYDNSLADVDGHGTHVAGTAGGYILGVASNANLFGVKALDADGGGYSSNVVAGIDYIVNAHDRRKREQGENFVGSVISVSLAASGTVAAISDAVEAAVEAGVHVVVAAGNAHEDACGTSPSDSGGRGGPAITVGSVGMEGRQSSFSNWGDCVDVYAPGEEIISSWIGGRNMIESLSGTSMATPHVTGIVACAMANQTLAADPGLMKEWVRMQAVVSPNQDILVANNGVKYLEDGGDGVLGFEKVARDEVQVSSKKHGGSDGDDQWTWANSQRGVMRCRRMAQASEDLSYLRSIAVCSARHGLVRRGLDLLDALTPWIR
ncbi:hypothetical protein KC318_g5184 [Hortaea werneckii]|uniref:Peptidase S8/S53 domain-containing protein n=1 Tax=Hortaea werneckii TaxID=91943 RepID=A0A3M7B9W7_HORWE|nr:hypothetical protein KC334_g5362 [Hortaea werneckii]KAI7012832.1 hypothetical protein KC355_g5284 [Hortaea werneckii]KAI7668597.1 hypothetical protein KC318_g5184 [Hortaea werneckii]RMY03160.1 hypothetical protein D0867_10790 [Hortaea werneckii]RMY36652.1 hypothetical protein D0866_03785 [Hortaea werneckii]